MTFLIIIVSPFGPHPQTSANCGLLNIPNVLERKPGTDDINF